MKVSKNYELIYAVISVTIVLTYIVVAILLAYPILSENKVKRKAWDEATWRACAQTRGYNSYRECVAFVKDGRKIGFILTPDKVEEVVQRWLDPEDFIEEDFNDYSGCDEHDYKCEI